MVTAYQLPSMPSYENHHVHRTSYALAAPPSDRPRPVLNERPAPNEQIFNPTAGCPGQLHSYQAGPTLPQPRVPSSISTGNSRGAPSQPTFQPSQSANTQAPARRQSTRPSTPTSGGTAKDQELSARDSAMIHHSLRIPSCISPNGGNLADFVADMTALFWFEPIQLLEAAENIRTIPRGTPIPRLSESGRASHNFKKYVQTVLSTTQVTQNVVLLALLFIYRLKRTNPSVDGRQGSEFRLFTVALMLGNKFLDDNTYTNKTWADVSLISVSEIHIMEVEFLSNMRYSLLVSKEQWEDWLLRLAQLHEFLELAQRSASPSPLLIPSPSHHSFLSPLPSPTGTSHLTPHNLYSPSANAFGSGHNGNHNGHGWPTYASNNAVSPLALKPDPTPLHRKRSFPEDDPTEPPAKRMSRVVPLYSQHGLSLPTQPAPQPPRLQGAPPTQLASQRPPAPSSALSRPAPAVATDHPRLSVPNLTLNTNHGPPQSFPAVSYAPPQASPLSLPPLVPGVRAMSTVFPTAPATYAPPHTAVSSTGPNPAAPMQPISATPTTAFPPTSYGTPTKRLSPQNALTPTAPYAGSSPLVDPFHHHSGTPLGNTGASSGVHTPISHSPSVYLQHRNSPYKPVRHVNTLLYPPPSAFLQQYHFPNVVPPTQMYYQPLGRRHELRTGIVPEFAMARAGHMGGGQHHAVTPGAPGAYGEMPQVLPRPNQGRPLHAAPIRRPVPYAYN